MKLKIDEPLHEQRFAGSAQAASVSLGGSVLSTGHGPLFYRWYSGVDGEMNPALLDALDIERPLTVGSHALTLTAKDVQGDTLTDIEAVEEAGMTGGPPEEGVEAPCVVHVFIAGMVEPAGGATLRRAGGDTLSAVAPKQWGRRVGTSNVYERNPDYHEVNRIRYHWRFQPSGPPAGRPGGDLIPPVEALKFGLVANGPMVVRYQGPLPPGLGTGSYTLTLRVEDKGDPTVGHETSLAVVLT